MSAMRKTLSCVVGFLLAALAPGPVLGQSLPLETIEKGEISYFRYGDAEFTGAEMVIKDPITWAWFWQGHTEGIVPAPPVPKVDFKVHMVLVAILGYQTTGGGPGIEIVSVQNPSQRLGKGLVVWVEENREPGPLDLITNPFHIVKVRRAASVIFERYLPPGECRYDPDCDEGSFCLYPEGQCAPPGTCAWREAACPAIVDPVCGCDAETYSSACTARQMGVSILHRGECDAPGSPGAR